MSTLLKIAKQEQDAAAIARRRSRRRLDRGLAVGGAVAVLALLAGVPMPAARRCNELAEKHAALELELASLRARDDELAAWEAGPKRQARAVHQAYRDWFSQEVKLLETRNHLLDVARVVGVELTNCGVSASANSDAPPPQLPAALGALGLPAPAGPVAPPASALSIPTTSEHCRIEGKGSLCNVVLFAALLPSLPPRIRLVSIEVSGRGATRTFQIEAERLYETPRTPSGAAR
jgi:hypothetical protein